MGKGSTLDLIPIMVIILIVSITATIGYYLNSVVMDKFEADGMDIMPFEYAQQGVESFNYGVLFMVLGLGVGVILGAFLLRSNPILFFFSVITLAIVITLSGVTSNVYSEFTETPEMADSVDALDVVYNVMDNLPIFILGIGVLVIIALYGFGYFAGGGG